MKVICPKCGGAIRSEDVNVAADRALCRPCDELFELRDLPDGADGFVALDVPPRGVRVQDYGGSSRLTVGIRKAVVIFFIIFTAIWSGISMWAAISSLINDGFTLQLLFFLPFFLGTLALLGLITFLLFGHTEAHLQDGTLTLFTGVGSLGYRRVVDFGRVERIWMAYGSTRVNDQPVKEIFIACRDMVKPMKFGLVMNQEQRLYAYHWLRSLQRRQSRVSTGPRSIVDLL